MPDPVTTGLTAIAAGHILKDSCTRLLGPTVDYLGLELKRLTEAQVERFRRIANSAERKSGSRLAEDGSVNARVFKKIIDDGCFCADGLSADYYGGLLASSRTKDGKDDANVPFASMINRMSSDQLHGHWILYALLFNKAHNFFSITHDLTPISVYVATDRKRAALYVPWRTFLFLFNALRTDHIEDVEPKFEFTGANQRHSVTADERLLDCTKYYSDLNIRRLDVVFWGLLSDNLVDHLYWGLTGFDLWVRLKADFSNDPLDIGPNEMGVGVNYKTGVAQGGIVFQPSILGLELFLRITG